MIIPPDYIQAERDARLANAEKLRSNLTSTDIREKILSWAYKYSLDENLVLYKVKTDDTFALHFIKDPVKQTFHQKIAANHVASLPLVSDFEVLPSGGTAAQYVVHGMIVPGSTLQESTTSHGKSIDFSWYFSYQGKRLRVVATHKHTKDNGGGQDLQFADVKRFLEEAAFSHGQDTAFLAICDGPYYQRPYGTRRSRIAALNEDCPGRRSKACAIGGLPSVYRELIQTWLTHHRLSPDAALVALLEQLQSDCL